MSQELNAGSRVPTTSDKAWFLFTSLIIGGSTAAFGKFGLITLYGAPIFISGLVLIIRSLDRKVTPIFTYRFLIFAISFLSVVSAGIFWEYLPDIVYIPN